MMAVPGAVPVSPSGTPVASPEISCGLCVVLTQGFGPIFVVW